jgi:release factor glutamine methyltransferase
MTDLHLTFRQLIDHLTTILDLKNISKPDLRHLVTHFFDIDLTTLFTTKIKVTESSLKKLLSMIHRLSNHEPIAYVLGECEFCGYSFSVDERVLIPRPETEEMVMRIIEMYSDHKQDQLNILDLCSGSGCIGISLKKKLPRTNVTFVDISKDALNLLDANLNKHNLNCEVIESDLFTNVNDTYDIIVTNPPYVAFEEKTQLLDSVKNFEPAMALFAPEQGLKIIKDICSQASSYLAKNGVLFLEHGWNQSRTLVNFCGSFEYKKIQTITDINMKERFMILNV